ncbi:MAG: phosphomannomutase/phosphoglucomutase [Bacilli bacterium]|nr:phosphomannomutase/phosphoglucomutase [Bacilli bacterium]
MDYNILRENDIRGIYPDQINKNVALIVGKAFGTYILSKKVNTCLVGYDNRTSGKTLHEKIVEGVLSTGVSVIDIGLSTTPLFNFSARELNVPFGIMITASHNPSNHNGFKVFGDNFNHLEQEELNKFYNIIKNESFKSGKGIKTSNSLQKEYIEMLVSKAEVNKNLKVIIDTGNGTPSIFIKDIFDKLFNDVIYLNDKSDGTFPVHNPDPNDPENLTELMSLVKEKNADIGLAFDGDGDRVGIVDNKGIMVPTDTLLAIYAENLIPKFKNKNVIIDVKCSTGLSKEIKRVGGNPIMVKNGSAYIENEMVRLNCLLGGEYSGHVFFRDDFAGYDDGIYASIRLLNIMYETNKNCSDLYKHMDKFYNTPEIKISAPEELKWSVVEKIKEYAVSKEKDVLTIDGVRINYDDGFSLIRGSNTSEYITLRFEAKSEKELNLRKREYINLVEYYIKN